MQRLRQLTFASLECDRKTRREIFLERMDGPIPWVRLLDARIAPVCPNGGGKGRQPHPLSAMLRVHCAQPFCNPATRRWRTCSARPRAFGALVGVMLEKVPDETTISTSAAGWSASQKLGSANGWTCCGAFPVLGTTG